MKAALELFTRKGYAATSVREIVAAAGVTKPVLYYYFENKEGIYLALMEQLFSRLAPLMEAAGPESGSRKSLLLDKFDRAFGVVHENSDLFRLMHATGSMTSLPGLSHRASPPGSSAPATRLTSPGP